MNAPAKHADGDGGQAEGPGWPEEIHAVLKEAKVAQAPYVPDGGHARLIELLHADPEIRAISLTTEEEGIPLAAGAWLGGERSVMLMQSSGVGNCINMLSLLKSGRFPFLTLVTMRGEWGEFNPWQVPMGSKVQQSFEMMDVTVMRADQAGDVAETVRAAARMAFEGGTPVAVLLSQRLIGAKVFVK
ncbi:phosphonopyruvate decarboxylase [Bosea sp. TWI1241]|uniref:phosphonopyruvate decarboxylase n=1 Tax=Bosea sp. TWI1241 TaxID=3148904 RepID=UPI00320B9DD2